MSPFDNSAQLVRLNLGLGGVAIAAREAVTLADTTNRPITYGIMNPDVRFDPATGMWHLWAEHFPDGTDKPSVIKYFSSRDGLRFAQRSNVSLAASRKNYRVGTPSVAPNDLCKMVYAQNPSLERYPEHERAVRVSMDFKIYYQEKCMAEERLHTMTGGATTK